MRKNGITTEDFVRKSREIHGNKYVYDETVYVNSNVKVVIRCPIHGDFEMRPNAHFGPQKQGCKACGGRPHITTESFIEKSKAKFPGKFDYSETLYVNATTDLTLICNLHGRFKTRPNNHLNGRGGCKVCGGRPDITTESFIRNLKSVFGDRYDLSKVEYNGAFVDVTLICPVHGEFTKKPSNIMSSDGCQACQRVTIDEFVKKANIVHEGKYDYSKAVYHGSLEHVTIVCQRHGEFEQTPNRHLDGRGCPACGVESNLLSNRSVDDECALYYIEMKYRGHSFWKIGITTKGVEHRYRLLAKDDVSIAHLQEVSIRLADALQLEELILRENKAYLSYRGHILKYAKGGTECFDKDVLLGKPLREFVIEHGVKLINK